jgi:hypothetical protein
MELIYIRQTELLLRVLPYIHEMGVFALHGGTAINLFHDEMPRLSVDIDLTYLPIEDRGTDLKAIKANLERNCCRVKTSSSGYSSYKSYSNYGGV